jgi:hypothetical protein
MAERIITVDFTGVESGTIGVHVPEGDYGVKVAKVDVKKGKESEKPYVNFQFKLTKGPAKGVGKTIPHTCSLQKQSLWNLRSFLEACGKQVPSKAVKLSLDKMVGWECAATLADDEYNGRKKSVVAAFFPLSDLEEKSSTDELEAAGEGETTEATADEETEELFN